jgi:hypothetical protein
VRMRGVGCRPRVVRHVADSGVREKGAAGYSKEPRITDGCNNSMMYQSWNRCGNGGTELFDIKLFDVGYLREAVGSCLAGAGLWRTFGQSRRRLGGNGPHAS